MSVLQTPIVTPNGFAFDSTTGETYTLNPSACSILQRLQQGESEQQVVLALSNEFGIPQSTIERDMTDFLQQLHTFGLAGASR
jgi:PqqD family protein of HPr-rel-A system